MTKLQMVEHNQQIYKETHQKFPTKSERWSQPKLVGVPLKITITRPDLPTDYTGMIGYQIGQRGQEIVVYLPLYMMSGESFVTTRNNVKYM